MKRAAQHQRFHLEALEPRILLSADGLAGAAASTASGYAASLEILASEPEKMRSQETGFDLFGGEMASSPYSAAAQVDDIFGSGNVAESFAETSPLSANAGPAEDPGAGF